MTYYSDNSQGKHSNYPDQYITGSRNWLSGHHYELSLIKAHETASINRTWNIRHSEATQNAVAEEEVRDFDTPFFETPEIF